MLRIAADLDVPSTGFASTSTLAGLIAAADATGFPCVVKPVQSPALLFGRKALILRSPAALLSAFARWPAEHAALLVERYVSGLRHNIHFAAYRGSLVGRLHGLTLRTDRVDGTGINTEGVSVPAAAALVDYTERITRRLDYTGVGVTQFVVDNATGDVAFLELNSRLPANTAFAMRCGLDLPALALSLAAGVAPHAVIDGREGIHYAWTSGDLEAWLAALHVGEVGRFEALRWLCRMGWAGMRADVHGSWQWNDPRPTWAHFAQRWRASRLGREARP